MKKILLLLALIANSLNQVTNATNIESDTKELQVLSFTEKLAINNNIELNKKSLFDNRFVKDNITKDKDYCLFFNSQIPDVFLFVAYKKFDKSTKYISNNLVEDKSIEKLNYIISFFANDMDIRVKPLLAALVFDRDQCLLYVEHNAKSKLIKVNKSDLLAFKIKSILQKELEVDLEGLQLFYSDMFEQTIRPIDSKDENLKLSSFIKVYYANSQLFKEIYKLGYLNIVKLDLSNAGITDAKNSSFDWKRLAHLKELNFEGNLLTTFLVLLKIPKLKFLNLSHNKIENIDLKCGRIKSFINLNLSNNKIKRLKYNLDHPWLDYIESLDLTNNDLIDVPNHLILWLFKGGKLKLNVNKDNTKPYYIKELNDLNQKACFKCGFETQKSYSEVRPLEIPVNSIDNQILNIKYNNKLDSIEKLPKAKINVSSIVCESCLDKNLEIKKFCWICLNLIKNNVVYACDKSHSDNQVLSNSSSLKLEKKNSQGSLQSDSKKQVESNFFKCDLCNIICTSQETLDFHFAGKKHNHKLELTKSQVYCSMCDARASNAHGYQMHINGKKHKEVYNEKCNCITIPDVGTIVKDNDKFTIYTTNSKPIELEKNGWNLIHKYDNKILIFKYNLVYDCVVYNNIKYKFKKQKLGKAIELINSEKSRK